jgi:membrane protein
MGSVPEIKEVDEMIELPETYVLSEQINKTLMLNKAAVNMRWVIGFVLLVAFFALVYKAVPERTATFLSQLPGAVFSAVGWIAFSGIFSVYINSFSDYHTVYGNLASAVILMLWLYFCMFILYTGAQINFFISHKKNSR